jgi:hypothetical protein
VRYGPQDRQSSFAVGARPEDAASELLALIKSAGAQNYKNTIRPASDFVRFGLLETDAEREAREQEVGGLLGNASLITQGAYTADKPTAYYDDINANIDSHRLSADAKAAAGLGLFGATGSAKAGGLGWALRGFPTIAGGIAKRAVGAAFPALGVGLLTKDLYDLYNWYNAPEDQK